MNRIEDIFKKEIKEIAEKKEEEINQSASTEIDTYVPRKRRPWLEDEEKDNNESAKECSIDENCTETNRKQTVNKLETNRKQSDNKSETNRKQTVNKLETPEDINYTNRKQIVNKTVNTTVNKLETNRKQTVNKQFKKVSLSELVGLQQKIVKFLHDECINSRSQVTNPLTIDYIANGIKCNKTTAKTTIQRLVNKNCIKRHSNKIGRGGWSTYELDEVLYRDALRSETVNKSETNRKQTVNKPYTEPYTESETNASSSSSLKDLKTTTTKPGDEVVLNFDISEYSEIFGFTKSHYQQLQQRFDDDEIIESLDNLLHDVKHDKKFNKSPIHLLMYTMRNQKVVYVSPEYQDHLRGKAEEVKRQLTESRRIKQELELIPWYTSLSQAQRDEIIKKAPLRLQVDLRIDNITQSDTFDFLWNEYKSI